MAALLRHNGMACRLLLRPDKLEQLAAVQAQISLRDSSTGEHNLWPVELCSAQHSATIDNLLLTTKAADALSALHSVAHRLAKQANIVVLQNGMGGHNAIIAAFAQHAIYAATTTAGVRRSGPFSIVRSGRGTTWIGLLHGGLHNDTGTPVKRLTQLSGMDVHFTDAIEQKLQDKLLVNAVVNGLTVRHNCRNGELLKPRFKAELYALCQETQRVLELDGWRTARPAITLIEEVLHSTADNISSTLQDVRNRKPTELAWLNGYLVAVAEQHGVKAPLHAALLSELHSRGIT